jgi:type VII secretion-associated serine protease mycosin
VTLLALATATIVACCVAPASAGVAHAASPAQAAPQRVIIGTTGTTAAARITRDSLGKGATFVTRAPGSAFIVVDAPAGRTAEQFARTYRGRNGVTYAEPDRIRTAQFAVDDPLYGSQWGLPRVGAPSAWNVTRGAGVVVAVIDTGVDFTHPDLRASLLTTCGYDFVNRDADPTDDNGHGTHVSGIVAATANNGLGGCGAAPEAKVMPIKVLGADGSGSDSDVALGIRWAASHGAKVINMSLGGEGSSYTIDQAVAYAESRDVVIVAAAGNGDGAHNPLYLTDFYPASAPGVLGVGATTSSDGIAPFSNYGPYVDVSAPGVDILSTTFGPAHGYASWSGTSMATPFAAGALALIRSRFPSYTWDQAAARLESTARDLGAPGRDDHFGYGRIDIASAVPAWPTSPTPDPSAPTSVAIGGIDRYETAVQASQHAFPSPGGSRTVLIATGGNFPDALGAGALAGAWDAPILLVPPPGKTTPARSAALAAVYNEIGRLGAEHAIILGGTGVVADTTKSQVAQRLGGARTVERWGGRNRYETARLVARAARARWVQTHGAFPAAAFAVRADITKPTVPVDALLASPLAFHSGRPILLVTDLGVPAATAASIRELGITHVTVIGSTSSVSGVVATGLDAIPGVIGVDRIGAPDPGADSVAIADYAETTLGMSYDGLALATADDFPDALAAGPLAGREGSVLLLTPPDALSSAVQDAVQQRANTGSITHVHFLGGLGVLPSTVRDTIWRTITH